MRILPAQEITKVVKRLCIQANCHLPQDVMVGIKAARATESWPLAQTVLDDIITNYTLANEQARPICQDTGMACVFVEQGEEVFIEGSLTDAVNEGVRQGYSEGYLRKSVLSDPLLRKNTGDNTPAMLYLESVPGDKVTITIAPKGFGSENMSAVRMLKPSDGVEGVVDFVVDTVRSAGPNPCPPIVVGVGIGGTFDKAALLAKKALLRPLGQPHTESYYSRLEARILAEVNKLGIGPQGYGGNTTALAVAIEKMPTHIAGLPCAVNINCHVARHAAEVL